MSLNEHIDCEELILCLCCKTENKLFLDLGLQPLANNYHETNEQCEVYPLKLKYCPNCFHCQLSHAVNPELLFKTYKYVSGTSQTGMDFFKDNAKFINDYKCTSTDTNIFTKEKRVLDIASNDGSQLDCFKELGWTTYGVDPATNLVPISIQKGHNVICDFWNESVAKLLPIMHVITAQNVFAHTQYLDEFLQACKLIMDDNTSLFIQTSQKNMIVNNEFDTTYHEHISFYNTKSMKTLVERNGLYLNRILDAEIHGHSYIFEISKVRQNEIYNVDKYLKEEDDKGIYDEQTYQIFNEKTHVIVSNLKQEIADFKANGYKCIGFGAAAKGQTVLCYGEIGLDYIIDENPLKIGLYSPKMDIPIVNIDHFINDTNTNHKENKYVILILAWNFATEIKEKIRKYKGDKKCVILEAYFPEIVIRKLL